MLVNSTLGYHLGTFDNENTPFGIFTSQNEKRGCPLFYFSYGTLKKIFPGHTTKFFQAH
jgi:hypothetical protein